MGVTIRHMKLNSRNLPPITPGDQLLKVFIDSESIDEKGICPECGSPLQYEMARNWQETWTCPGCGDTWSN